MPVRSESAGRDDGMTMAEKGGPSLPPHFRPDFGGRTVDFITQYCTSDLGGDGVGPYDNRYGIGMGYGV